MIQTPTDVIPRADGSSRGATKPVRGEAILKKATGIPGFDGLAEGGLPVGGITAIVGDPGSGKTVFALQTLVTGLRQRDERAILVLFEEQKDQIRLNFASFDWKFAEIGDDEIHMIDAQLPLDAVRSGVFDFSALLAVLTTLITESGARNIAFDGIDILLGVLNDETLERQEIMRLREWVRGSGVTAILTVKDHGATARELHRADFLQYMTDCVVVFKNVLSASTFSRTVRIAKYRGSSFAANPMPFVIGGSGLEVVGYSEKRLSHPTFSERVSSGVPRLDDRLDGGYLRGSCILISGAPGTSKSSLAASFLAAACHRGHRSLFVSFDESGAQIISNMKSIGLELEAHVRSGLLTMEGLLSSNRSSEEHYVAIRELLDRQYPDFLVIDPLSALLKMNAPFAEMICERILERAKSAGITVVCTSLLEKVGSSDELSASHVSTIADTWLHVSFHARQGERNRALTIVKSRGTAHSNQVSELIMSSHGIQVADVYSAEGDVLMGSARLQKQAGDRRQFVQEELTEQRRRLELERDLAELKAIAAKTAKDLEWKEREAELFERNRQTMREAEQSDADDRLTFRTNRFEHEAAK